MTPQKLPSLSYTRSSTTELTLDGNNKGRTQRDTRCHLSRTADSHDWQNHIWTCEYPNVTDRHTDRQTVKNHMRHIIIKIIRDENGKHTYLWHLENLSIQTGPRHTCDSVTFIEPCSKATRPEQWQSTGIPPCCPEKGSADAVFKSSQTFKLNISTS